MKRFFAQNVLCLGETLLKFAQITYFIPPRDLPERVSEVDPWIHEKKNTLEVCTPRGADFCNLLIFLRISRILLNPS